MYAPPGGVVIKPQKRPIHRKYTRPHDIVISPYKGPPPRLLLPKFLLAIFLIIGLTACGIAIYLIYDSRIELGRIECNLKDMIAGKEYYINITCYDFKDRPLKDVHVSIEGGSIDNSGTSDINGFVQFKVCPLLPMNVHNDIVRVVAYHPAKPDKVCTHYISVHD